MTTPTIPTFQQAAQNVGDGKPSALDVFVYTQQPPHPRSELFRRDLLAVLKEAMGIK